MYLDGQSLNGKRKRNRTYYIIYRSLGGTLILAMRGYRFDMIWGYVLPPGANIVDVIEAYGADFIGNIVYCGGVVLTRTLHNNYIHPYLSSLIPEVLSLDADVVAAAAPRFVESIVENVDKVLTYREQLMYMGGFASMLPTARVHLITRTQASDRWEREIKSKKVILIQGTNDRHARADGLVAEAKKWLGDFELRLLEGCGHSPVLERPHEVNEYILNFCLRNALEKSI